MQPIVLGRRQALEWVERTLIQTRGRELAGNFNPLLIGELFREQSQNWEIIAQEYAEEISQLCDNFVGDLLQELCPKDIYTRIRFGHIQNVPKERLQSSQAELKTIIAGKRLYPMTIIIITRRQSKRFALRERKRSLKSVLQKRQRQLPITRIPARVTSPS